MKKWLEGILCGISVVSVMASSGCFLQELDFPTKYNFKTASETYSSIEADFSDTTNFTMDIVMAVEPITEGQATQVRTSILLKKDGDNSYLESSNTILEETSSRKDWYVDGIGYFDLGENKYKMEMTPEAFLAYSGPVSLLRKVKSFEDVEFVKEEGGAYFVAPLTTSELNALASSIRATIDDAVISSDVEYVIHVNKRSKLRYTEVKFEITQLKDNVTINYTYNYTITLKDVNKTVITLPENASEFVDMNK